jgi:predicted 2-oxoglutarate/Fe(II)-dependent dioxygenase YbiX
MPRILQVGDFIPDFTFSNADREFHSAALAGQAWVLIVLRNATQWHESPELQRAARDALAENTTLSVVALSGSGAAPQTADDSALTYACAGDQMEPIFFDRDKREGRICCMAIDHSQKIVRRVDCHPREAAVIARELARESLPGQQTGNIAPVPVLKVPAALPEDFCANLVEHFRQEPRKIQGRAGQSNPRLDPSVKRVVHVNTDPDLGKAIDRLFVFSLLPAIERVFDYRVTHRVAYKISAYSGKDQGFFAAHRDNSDAGTLFRRFALSVCLNDDWEGGGICFPEYTSTPLELATGDALVFPASLMHRVEPIRQGERFVLLSFLYDEKHARDRRASMQNPEILDEKYIDAIDETTLSAYRRFSPASRFSPQYSR